MSNNSVIMFIRDFMDTDIDDNIIYVEQCMTGVLINNVNNEVYVNELDTIIQGVPKTYFGEMK